MTAAPGAILQIPAKPDLVAETIRRFDVAGLRSSLLKLDDGTLSDLGLRLTDRKLTVAQAWAWLNKELGGTEEEPAVPERNVYRFAEHFRRLFAQVRGEHCRRIAKLRVEDATAGHVGSMRSVATARLIDLITEKLVETDNLEELSATEISAAIATLDALSKAEFRGQELALKVAEGERKTQKLEADLKEKELKLTQLQEKIDKQQREYTAKSSQAVAALEAATAGGASGGAEAVVNKVREILGLA